MRRAMLAVDVFVSMLLEVVEREVEDESTRSAMGDGAKHRGSRPLVKHDLAHALIACRCFLNVDPRHPE